MQTPVPCVIAGARLNSIFTNKVVAFRSRTETIQVDIDRLELTPGPFKIYKADGLLDVETDQQYHEGYIVSLGVDIRDVLGSPKKTDANGNLVRKKIPPFPFKARVYRPDALLIETPLLSFSDRGNDDEDIRAIMARDGVLLDALDDSRHAYIERHGSDHQTAFKHYILEFSHGVHLSSKCLKLHKGKKNGEMKLEAINLNIDISKDGDVLPVKRVTVTDPLTNQQKQQDCHVWVQNALPRLFWRVADDKKRIRKRGKTTFDDEDDEATEAAAALLAAASIS